MIKRILTVTALAALMVAPASAQMGGGRHHGHDQQKSEKKPQVDEKAYKAALERIPDPKTKYDPWGMTRPSTPVKK